MAGTAQAQGAPASYEAASDVRVRFEAEPADDDADGPTPGLVLSQADGRGGWRQIGIAPCELVLSRAPVTLALAAHGHAPVRVVPDLVATEGARLVGHYESRQWLRELGVGIVLGAAALTLIGIAIAVTGFLATDVTVGAGGLVAAGSVAVVGGATGIALATLDDLATIELL